MKDVKVNITKADKTLVDNLVRILGRVKVELEGAEILLASDSMRWLVRFQKQIEEEAKKPDIQITNQEPIKALEPTPTVKKGKK